MVEPEGHIFDSRSKSKIVNVNPPSKVNNNTILSAYTNMTHKWDKPCDHRQRDPHQTIRKPPFLKVYRWKLRDFNLHYLQNENAKIRELNIKQSCEEIPVTHSCMKQNTNEMYYLLYGEQKHYHFLFAVRSIFFFNLGYQVP